MSEMLLYVSANKHSQCTGAEKFRRPGSPALGSAETGMPLMGWSAHLSSGLSCWKGTESMLWSSTFQAHASTSQPSLAARQAPALGAL